MKVDLLKKFMCENPDIALESPVQGWVFLREFEQGIACYDSLGEKTGFDDRWAGICYFHLHQDMRAVELFYRAIARGVSAARINLAHALGYIERGDEVIPELLKVDHNALLIYDKVLYYRVKSLHEETSGDLRTALVDAERAWQLVQGAPQHSVLAPDILSQLAVLHGRIGQAQKALKFIENNLSMSTGVHALRARIHRAHILITLGRFTEALFELESLDLSTTPMHLRSIVYVHCAEAEWALGHMRRAANRFEMAAEVALELEIGFEEFLARIGLALLYGFDGQMDLAFEHLRGAERLVADRSDRLCFRFREILLLRLRNSISAQVAITELRTVAEELGKMGALQEQGWVRLHIAHELWRLNAPEHCHEVREIQKLMQMLQNPAFLSRELRLLPTFAGAIVGLHFQKQHDSPVQEVISLDDEHVT